MKKKPSAATIIATPTPAPFAAPIFALPTAPAREPWYRSVFTDREGDFDTGRVLVAIVILGMCWMQWYDVQYGVGDFDPQKFGTGVAAVLGGFAAYLWGDTRRPPGPSTMTSIKQEQVSAP